MSISHTVNKGSNSFVTLEKNINRNPYIQSGKIQVYAWMFVIGTLVGRNVALFM